jgi:2-dehydro-3-deoxygluconokinase
VTELSDHVAPEWDVVTFGEAMALLLAEPGVPLTEATAFRRTVAGSESNVATGLARLGHRVGWFGRVGDDAFGQVVLRALRGEGVDVSRARLDPAAPTGLLVRDGHGQRPVDVLYYRAGSAGSRLSPDDVDPGYIAAARLLHLTGITPVLSEAAHQATERAVRIARDAGALISFDPNIRLRLTDPDRARQVLRPLAAAADIVLAGADEAELLTGKADASWFLDHGAGLVVIKNGAAGSWATDGTDTWRQGAVPVHALDPVGAGDAFAAGFLSGHLAGLDVPERLLRGATLSAQVVQVVGDTEGLPYGLTAGVAGEVRR